MQTEAERVPAAASAGDAPSLDAAVEAACALVPPLWTLRNFVAVNPYLGFTDLRFRDAADALSRIYHARTFLALADYRSRHARGRIRDADLEAALAEAPQALGRPISGTERTALRWAMFGETPDDDGARVRTVAEAVDHEDGSRWAALVRDEISKWCAGRFDRGQAAWAQPWRDRPMFAAWRELAALDRNPEVRGLDGFRAYVRRLPEKPMDAIAQVLDQLGLAPASVTELLARELASIAGWAGHVQYRAREAAFAGRHDASLRDLLAIRLAFDGALDHALGGRGARLLAGRADAPVAAGTAQTDAALVWQLAYEGAFRRRLLRGLDRPGVAASGPRTRPRLQAVFCIDVRSERLRRHLESLSPSIQTLGFAGFFGFPVETVQPGDACGEARCPVLIQPPYRVRRAGPPAAAARRERARARHRLFAKLRKLTVGAFSLAETVGYAFGARLVTDSLTWTRPQPDGGLFEAPFDTRALAPRVAPEADAPDLGIPPADQIDLAEGALRNMSLTDGFAEIVLVCGHGARTTNNPHASSLECGACGGHPGDESARIAARVLNTPAVRAGLAERGIHVPDDTRFVAALHDTTRDTVTLLDAEDLPAPSRQQLVGWLDAACERTAAERSRRLGGESVEGLRRRARDWSEVRPEWGLAGNAAFVAAPRHHTRGLDLEGRAFLHDYDPDADPEGRVLELILTAPLVVASWINLQYYASTVDNEVFGSGSKVLHNVVGRHGVMTGNRSDLRVGLPWQSVHDGRDYVHEPLRLLAVVQAPTERIDAVLAAHPEVRALVENDWVRLVAWDPQARRFARRGVGAGVWELEVWEPEVWEPEAPAAARDG